MKPNPSIQCDKAWFSISQEHFKEAREVANWSAAGCNNSTSTPKLFHLINWAEAYDYDYDIYSNDIHYKPLESNINAKSNVDPSKSFHVRDNDIDCYISEKFPSFLKETPENIKPTVILCRPEYYEAAKKLAGIN